MATNTTGGEQSTGLARVKDMGRKTDAAKWEEGIVEAIQLAQSDDSSRHGFASDQLNKHCHTENEKHRAIELGVLPALFALLNSPDEDAPMNAKITLALFGFKRGMSLEEVDTAYRANWLPAERVEAAKNTWRQLDEQMPWTTGKELMEAEVEKNGGKIGALTWGETSFDSLAIMLGYVKPQPGERFLDLGAGLGKVLAAAHLLCDFSECLGLELIEGLVEAGQGPLRQFSENHSIHEGTMELRQGDFLQEDWSSYDVVFANASLFPKDLLQSIADKMDAELKDGARVIMITNSLKGERLKQMNARRLYCQHQEDGNTPATFFLYKAETAAAN